MIPTYRSIRWCILSAEFRNCFEQNKTNTKRKKKKKNSLALVNKFDQTNQKRLSDNQSKNGLKQNLCALSSKQMNETMEKNAKSREREKENSILKQFFDKSALSPS